MSDECLPPAICPCCGVPVVCGMKTGADRCWCADFPAALPVPKAGTGCYCPACLKIIVEESGREQEAS